MRWTIDKTKIMNFFKKWYIFLFLAIIYIPLVLIIILSFDGQTERGNINTNFDSFSIDNYFDLFENNQFVNALINSLLLALVVTPVVLIIATMTSFGIWQSQKKIQVKSVLMSSNLTITSPDAITGISLLLLFSATLIPLGFNLGFLTVALAHISFGVPYALVVIYPRIAKMNPNLIYASYDLGYSKTATFFKVVIPFLSPAIISGATIAFAMSLDDFVITNLVNGSFQTIGTAIYSTRKGVKAWVVTFGAIIVLITIAIVVVNSIKKYIQVKINNRNKAKGGFVYGKK